jgi:hypothetical protein
VKPDLVLIDCSYHEALSDRKNADPRVSWLRVRSFAELTASSRVPQQMPATIDAKSYVLLTYQFGRCFALALSLSSTTSYTLTLSDREGQIRFCGLPLTNENRYNASNFLRILAFLMFGTTSDIGFDPNFVSDENGKLVAVKVNGHRFELHRRIYTLRNICSVEPLKSGS